MKKLTFLTELVICVALLPLSGCSGKTESTVIEAPPVAAEEQPAMEGMTDEEYDAAMDADMSGE